MFLNDSFDQEYDYHKVRECVTRNAIGVLEESNRHNRLRQLVYSELRTVGIQLWQLDCDDDKEGTINFIVRVDTFDGEIKVPAQYWVRESGW